MDKVLSGDLVFFPVDYVAENGWASATIKVSPDRYQPIGWVKEDGFYIPLSDGRLVKLTASQLIDMCDHLDLLKLDRIAKEMDEGEKAD